MSNIRFIVQGSPDTAADTAYELQQYLETAWQVQVEATPADTSTLNATDANSKGIGFDSESIQILLGLYGGIKLAIDSAHGLLETRKKLEELVAWATPILTRDHEYIWLEVSGIPYPVKAENMDDIIKAMQVQE
ncbi:hypothetical protein [Candidatus Thiothrix anitrata]|uniref:Uncharacterized protein n=1 Tax=Candidatus Thiothrix anitrata TaxID=2823902 RepID=A0ABX7X211_9GAMM|nr:hypothetical protein [Candidatus Thiothrix anitrata]QTR49930.1 hypothetical protein J8380_17185 [Candidatus Thiothrix anitrata]